MASFSAVTGSARTGSTPINWSGAMPGPFQAGLDRFGRRRHHRQAIGPAAVVKELLRGVKVLEVVDRKVQRHLAILL